MQKYSTEVADPVAYEAFVRLMARPDPRDLPRRAHVPRFAGDPDRRATRFPGIFMGWLQRHYLDVDVEEPLSSPTRSLRLVRRPVDAGPRALGPTGTGQAPGTVMAGRRDRVLARAPRSAGWTSKS